MRHTFILTSLLSAFTVASNPALAADPAIIIKLSHVVASDTSKGRGAEFFKKLAEERTKGRVQVQIYPNSQLYKDKEELEALQMGSVQMLIPSVSKFGPLGVKDFEAFDLPYLFNDLGKVHEVSQGTIGKQMMEKLTPYGIKGLGFWDNGFKSFLSNSPIVTPADLKGKKIRIQSSKVLEAQMRVVNALPQSMAFSEVYQALQTGVVDGTEQTPTQAFSQRFHEVQKYLTVTNHGYLGYAVVVNKKFWDGLPGDIRTTLESAMAETTSYVNKVTEQENEDDLKKIAASGKTTITRLTPAQIAVWKKAFEPTYEQVQARLPSGLVSAVKTEVAN